jgi:hypothetical protein
MKHTTGARIHGTQKGPGGVRCAIPVQTSPSLTTEQVNA